jgi:hypothetical protein
MSEAGLLAVCAIAFLIVFVVLTVLAVTIRVVAVLLPAPEGRDDAALVAAVTASAAAAYPAHRVTRLVEES